MKKYIISVLLLSAGFSFASAQTSDVDTSSDNSCAIITSNLRYLSRDANGSTDVSILQDFLNTRGYLKSQPTGFFGSATRRAVIAFQNDNGLRATPPGFVGAGTRAKIQAIDCNNTSAINTTPSTNNINTPSLPTVGQNSITVTYPNGGENLTANEADEMPKGFNFVTRWTSNNLSGTTNVYLISATDGSVCLLGSAPTRENAFGGVLGASFKCKNTPKLLTSGQYKIRLIADTQSPTSDLGVNDMSDNYFTLNVISSNNISSAATSVTPIITVVSPKGGEVYSYGQSIPFSWKRNTTKDMLAPTVYLDSIQGGSVDAYGNFLPDIYGAGLTNVNTTNLQNGVIPSNIILPITGGKVKLVICEYPKNTNNNAYPKIAPFCAYSDTFTISPLDTSSSPAPTASLKANPTSITVGQATTLTTGGANAPICTGIGTDGTKFYGTGAVYPIKTTTYTYTCYQSSDLTGKTASASVTVNVSSAPISATSPYINTATMESGNSNPDGNAYLQISGTGFTMTSQIHIKGDGFDGFLSPVSNYSSGNGSNGKNITILLPASIDTNKQYDVYVSNGGATSNTISTTKPFQG